jgi:predicted nucleotidyltransferase
MPGESVEHMITEEQIQEVVERLRRAAPDATIILFGSHARGNAREGSDLDILVVEPVVESTFDEIVRLGDEIGGAAVPVDILVTSEATFSEWVDEPCTIIYEAAHHGRVVYAPT